MRKIIFSEQIMSNIAKMHQANQNRKILISDPTLRDGNHAIKHQLNAEQIKCYALAADAAGIPIIEVGHGNGLGASSLQVGEALMSDHELIEVARKNIVRGKLGVHCIPSFATINRDLRPAIDMGVDVFRVATHCTEADTTQKHINFLRGMNKEVYGTLMMTHMASPRRLAEECKKLESYGAIGLVIMDSVGAYLPNDVSERIKAITDKVDIIVGFHAHNNLGMAVANSIAAIDSGARLLDASARGFGAGAGNTQLEVLIAVLQKLGFETGIDLYKVLDASDLAEKELMDSAPVIRPISIVSGLSGVFSGFAKHVERVGIQYGVDPKDIFFELGRRKVVAGQEDVIIEVAMDLLAQENQELMKSRMSDAKR